MVVLGTTIHEFAGVIALPPILVDGRTKSDHDEKGEGAAFPDQHAALMVAAFFV